MRTVPDQPGDVDIDGHGERFLPSPDEIAAECAAIRSAWPAEEFERRYVGPGRQRWRLPGADRGHAVTVRRVL